jgi:hypothetical protein
MALVSTNFLTPEIDLLLEDFSRELNLFGVLVSAPQSQEITRRLIAAGGPNRICCITDNAGNWT